MTLKFRNRLFILGLALEGGFLLLYTAGMGNLLIRYPGEFFIGNLFYQAADSGHNVFPLFLLNIFLFTSGLILFLAFRKTSSAEIFFFFAFLMFTGCEGFRLGLIYVDLADLPFQLKMALSRFVYFGRFFGTLSLFSAGIFSCGIPYQRLELMISGCFLVALTLAIAIPLSNAHGGMNLLYANGLNREFLFGLKIVEALGVGSLLYAVYLHSNPNYYFLAGGMALVAIGKEILLLPSGGVLSVLGLLGLVLGTVIFGNKTHEIYLWL